ncbi:MAG TPA: 3'(2'),5'-bisphosphate nucleotidase CysQ [Steroidobacteraceae bacterium]|nr:3'(2'),5'-bisphosphate nucleotidase CysQ [Steroidobacteraceae bacterium]
MSDSQLLEVMVSAAIEAGRAACALYRGQFQVETKQDQSPVTAADHAAEAVILARLAAAAPTIPVVAEEQVAAGRVPQTGREFFLVDPLDGTKEFIQRRGDFTVNIALVRERLPVLGVVYAPAKSQLFGGDVGARHAFRSEQPVDRLDAAPRVDIHVRTPPAVGLTVVASRSHLNAETDQYLRRLKTSKLVSVGSSLKFCLVASGEADVYPRLGPTMEWDTAAGHAVLAAAGGTVINLDSTPFRYGKPEFRNPSFIATSTLTVLPQAFGSGVNA